MKLRIVIILYTLFATTVANAQLSTGLVGYWNFSGNANDVSGNGLNGTATNVSYTTGKNGIPNTAASFNGTNSVISIPYDSRMNLTQLTICAMVKFNNFYSGPCQHSMILQRGSFFTGGSYSLSIFENAYDNGNCNKYDSTKLVFHQKVANRENSTPLDSFKHSPNVQKNQWYCVVATCNGSRTEVYVDGVRMLSYSSSLSFGTSTEGLAIGANIFAQMAQYPYWINGVIDDVRLYNRVLSPSEVSMYCNLFDTVIITQDPAKTALCMDDTFHLSYTVSDPFQTGNVFTAQLSDATGNFSSPVNIGSVTSTIQGTIACTVPTGLTPGSGYRVRVVSTNPVRVSDVTSVLGVFSTLIPSVTISANPSGPVQQNQYITFTATPVDAGTSPTFQWYRNGQPIFGAMSNSLYINTLNDSDRIHVVVTSSNPCPPDLNAQSNTIITRVNVSVNDIQLGNLSLYPNPNSGGFIVTADNIGYDDILLEVINPVGQIIQHKQVFISNQMLNERIELSSAANGLYMLRISSGDKQRNIRFIINK